MNDRSSGMRMRYYDSAEMEEMRKRVKCERKMSDLGGSPSLLGSRREKWGTI